MAEPLTPETIAKLRRLCEAAAAYWPPENAFTKFGVAARTHLPALLDQIEADRALIEEAAKVLEPVALRARDVKAQWGDRDVSVMVEVGYLRAAATLFARLRNAVPAEERQS